MVRTLQHLSGPTFVNALRRLSHHSNSICHTDLQLWLEESTSDLPATEDDGPGAKNGRKDLVYYPQLEDDRDAAVLASERLPEHFKDTLRFDRASGVKFLDQLKRGLRM